MREERWVPRVWRWEFFIILYIKYIEKRPPILTIGKHTEQLLQVCPSSSKGFYG